MKISTTIHVREINLSEIDDQLSVISKLLDQEMDRLNRIHKIPRDVSSTTFFDNVCKILTRPRTGISWVFLTTWKWYSSDSRRNDHNLILKVRNDLEKGDESDDAESVAVSSSEGTDEA